MSRFNENSENDVVEVPDSVEEIGERAFCLNSFGGIILPDGLKKIEDYAFARSMKSQYRNKFGCCEYIGSKNNPYMVLVDINGDENGVINIHPDTRFMDSESCRPYPAEHGASSVQFGDKLEFIGSRAFAEGFYEHLEIPESVTQIREDAFYQCADLKSVKLPSKLQIIEKRLFARCESLKDVIFPDNPVTVGDGAFDFCTSLESMTLPESVREIGMGAFFGCNKLNNVYIGNNVTKIGKSAFRGCISLESIGLPEKLEEISEDLFFRCEKLKSVNIPCGVKKIGKDAFSYCLSLKTLHIPSSVEYIDDCPFNHCMSLESITVDPDNKNYFMHGDSLVEKETGRSVWVGGGKTFDETYFVGNAKGKVEFEEFKNNRYLQSIIVSSNAETIESGAFCGCSALKKVRFMHGVKEIGFQAFRDCVSLERIVIPESVRKIDTAAFRNCSSLKEVKILGKNLTLGERVFIDCTSLESVYIGNGVTLGCGVFVGCSNLKAVNVAPDNPLYYVRDGGLFARDGDVLIWSPEDDKA